MSFTSYFQCIFIPIGALRPRVSQLFHGLSGLLLQESPELVRGPGVKALLVEQVALLAAEHEEEVAPVLTQGLDGRVVKGLLPRWLAMTYPSW